MQIQNSLYAACLACSVGPNTAASGALTRTENQEKRRKDLHTGRHDWQTSAACC